MNVKGLLHKTSQTVVNLATSPKFMAVLGVAVAVVKLAAAVDEVLNSARRRKKIGFDE